MKKDTFRGRLVRSFSRAISVAIISLFPLQAVFACSWDYPIWQNRSKNAASLYRFLKGDKAGYIDRTGRIVIPPTFDYSGNSGDEFLDGLLLTGVGDGEYVDTAGKIALDTKYYRNWEFFDGLAVAMEKDGDKWGYIDRTGKFVISPRFGSDRENYIYNFSDGLAKIQVSKLFGYIDHTGEFVIGPRFLYGENFYEGFARVVIDGPCGRKDAGPCGDPRVYGEAKAGQEVSACKYTFIGKDGSLISEQRFASAGNFSEGLAPVMVDKKWGYINGEGKIVISARFQYASEFSDGLALFQEGELWGFIDKKGVVVIPAQFEMAQGFSDGLAPVAKWNKKNHEYEDFFFIDKRGKRAFPGKFLVASSFFKGIAHVKLYTPNHDPDEFFLNGKYAYIDTTGKRIFEYERKNEDD